MPLQSAQSFESLSVLFLFFLGFDIPEVVCASTLGMENGKIPDSAIVASSRYNQYWGPERGRLNEDTEGNLFSFAILTSVLVLYCYLNK